MEKTGFKEKKLSRREVILGGGMVAAGAVAMSAVSGPGIGLLSTAEARETPLPWPYEKIDPQEAAKIAYADFYKAKCSYAVARGIMVPLQKKIGEPYTSLPIYDALKIGAAGIAGWGTVCGALLGSTIVTGLVVPPPVGMQLMNELFQWYADASLPVFVPEKPVAEIKTQSISKSPLCHISVGKWCKKSGKPFKSPEQDERCARLSADVAMRTVMLLNEWKDGKFTSALKLPPAVHGMAVQHNCKECHIPKTTKAGK